MDRREQKEVVMATEGPIPLWALRIVDDVLSRHTGDQTPIRELLTEAVLHAAGFARDTIAAREQALREQAEAKLESVRSLPLGAVAIELKNSAEALLAAVTDDDMHAAHASYSALAASAAKFRQVLVDVLAAELEPEVPEAQEPEVPEAREEPPLRAPPWPVAMEEPEEPEEPEADEDENSELDEVVSAKEISQKPKTRPSARIRRRS